MVLEPTVNVKQVLRFIRTSKTGRSQVIKLLAAEFAKELVNSLQIVPKKK
jgi:hypothetical protein